MPAYVLRSMVPDDAPLVAPLLGELGYPVSPPELILRFEALDPTANGVFIAEESQTGILCGWIHVGRRALLLARAEAEILGLVVASRSRGEGCGRSLVEEAFRWARSRGFEKLRVSSNLARDGSHEFYRRLGFTKTKESAIYHRTVLPIASSRSTSGVPLATIEGK